jgi:poly [ADP-ribose] polymerase
VFGKGIYLADMSSKSANYCAHSLSDNAGLLLLCEAELGKPMLELVNADYDAGTCATEQASYSTLGKGMTVPKKWKDAGVVHEGLMGAQMPDVSAKPGPSNVAGACLE